jgi:hypothetical protein
VLHRIEMVIPEPPEDPKALQRETAVAWAWVKRRKAEVMADPRRCWFVVEDMSTEERLDGSVAVCCLLGYDLDPPF